MRRARESSRDDGVLEEVCALGAGWGLMSRGSQVLELSSLVRGSGQEGLRSSALGSQSPPACERQNDRPQFCTPPAATCLPSPHQGRSIFHAP